MAHLSYFDFSPYLTVWDTCGGDGTWLHNFLNLLCELPSKNPELDHKEDADFKAMWLRASHFICNEFFCCNGLDPDRDLWNVQIKRANEWYFTFEVPQEFADFVKGGRNSTMSYDEVWSFLADNECHLLPRGEEDVRTVALYLSRLRALQVQVRTVIDYIAMTNHFEVQGRIDHQTYTFDPYALYEEFKRHYAYETALCIPML